MKNTAFSVFFLLMALNSIAAGQLDEIKVPQPQVEQGESWNNQDVSNTDSVLELMRKKLIADTNNGPLMRRDAHPKHHGCVKAYLNIDNKNLPDEFKKGIFEKNANYESVIRFSNGDPNHKKEDIKGDARGMALKVMGVPYDNYLGINEVEQSSNTHDFVFMNAPVFFVKDTKMYAKLMKSLDKGGLSIAWFAATHPKMLINLLKASSMKVYNPLDPDYHSATAYKLGKTSMKMKFASCKKAKDIKPKKPSNNFLSERLASYLKQSDSCFDFYVQPNKDLKKNDVENPMDLWASNKSPFIKVGRLEIPTQDGIHAPKRQEFCENASFNPWRSHVENRPLGAVNRTRLEVYVKQAKFRQSYNNTEDPMPAGHKDIN